MQFVVDQLSLLGLNAREIRTFTTIATFGQMKITVIARRANLPRTTVDAIVRRLERQGIIEPVLVEKHFEWRTDLERVAVLLNILRGKITPSTPSAQKQDTIDHTDEFFVKHVSGDEHEGLKNNTPVRRVCAVHLTPRGILLSELSGKRGVYIEHKPLRLKLSQALPSSLWQDRNQDVEENEIG